MATPLSVLIIETAPGDAVPMLQALTRGGFAPEASCISSAGEMSSALATGHWDVVLSGSSGAFGASAALDILKQTGLDVPLIVVSGATGGNLAIDMMRAGAADYVPKRSMASLAPAVERELREAHRRLCRRKEDEQAQRLASIVLSSTGPIVLETLNGIVTSWNAAAERLFGWSSAESIGQNISFMVPDDMRPQLASVMTRLLARERVAPFDTVRLHKDGSRVDVEVTLSAIVDPAGTLVGVSNCARDIGEKKRAEAAARAFADALRVSEDRHRLLVENMPHMVWTADGKGATDYLNQRGAQRLGITADVINGSGWLDLLHADDRAAAAQRWEAVLQSGEPYASEYRVRYPDGTYRWMLAQAVALRGEDGTVERWVGTWTDIDDRKEAEALTARHAELLRSVREAVIVTDLDGIVTYWNEGATRLYGWTEAEMVGRPVAGRFPEGARAVALDASREALDNHEWSGEFEDYRRDGSRVWISSRTTRIADASGAAAGIMSVAYDISARVHAEQALHGSEERFQQIAGSISEAFWLTDQEKQEVVYVSAAYETIWGRSRASLYATPTQWADAIHEEDRARVLEAVRTKQASGEYDEQYRILRPDGSIRWVRDRAFPVRGASDRVVRIAGVAEDVTDRLQLEAQLRQSQKMEAVGQLAGGVAHDFNNLVTIIMGYSELLLDDMAKNDRARESVDEIIKAAYRATALTSQLLAFSRKQVLAPRVVDLNATVRDTEKLLRRIIGEDVELTTRLQPELGCVKVDAGQFAQTLVNLAVNARDAMPQGGALTIETSNLDLETDLTTGDGVLRAGPHVVVTLTDSGEGMTDEVKRHLFEPFFTTKEPGKGTGLGLSVVHGFVRQSGGHIDVQSELGSGTVVTIYLPLVAGAPDEKDAPAGTLLPRGTETILLVEDEPGVRALSARVLRQCGYAVIEAGRGDDALRLGQPPQSIDLLVTDVVMPGGGGRMVAEQLLESCPGLRVLFVSGYTDDAVVRTGVLQAQVNFLQKPFSPLALALKVRQVLDSARPA
ncbi:MAG: PAS domain S-box protein [Acidobacteriota bacterium]|nr:PAS domain S-box protein [Acidobacteriota bacterium]